LHDHLGWEAAGELGLSYIESEMPEHDFVAIRMDGDSDAFNAGLMQHGLNLIVTEA